WLAILLERTDKGNTQHKGGPRFETEVRFSQEKYYYKYIINGDWRHSIISPTERDDRGNTNNIIVVGDVANVMPTIQQPRKVVFTL
ncbi:unnamed protein product, partial [Brassica rapa subsp. narinosa]